MSDNPKPEATDPPRDPFEDGTLTFCPPDESLIEQIKNQPFDVEEIVRQSRMVSQDLWETVFGHRCL